MEWCTTILGLPSNKTAASAQRPESAIAHGRSALPLAATMLDYGTDGTCRVEHKRCKLVARVHNHDWALPTMYASSVQAYCLHAPTSFRGGSQSSNIKRGQRSPVMKHVRTGKWFR